MVWIAQRVIEDSVEYFWRLVLDLFAELGVVVAEGGHEDQVEVMADGAQHQLGGVWVTARNHRCVVTVSELSVQYQSVVEGAFES